VSVPHVTVPTELLPQLPLVPVPASAHVVMDTQVLIVPHLHAIRAKNGVDSSVANVVTEDIKIKQPPLKAARTALLDFHLIPS